MNMNPQTNSNSRDEIRRFDRLVDGQLSPAEYRDLLASLDDEPAAWRQCALAFLESQALAAELGAVRRGLAIDVDSTGHSQSAQPGHRDLPRPHRWRHFDLATLLAVAASFLVAFGLGVLAPRFFSRPSQDLTLAGNISPQSGDAAAGPVASDKTDAIRHQAFRPVANVRLVMDGPGGEATQATEVPVYEFTQGLDQFLSQDRPALTPELVDLLRQTGHEVERQQQYVPGQLEDGRQVIVPVEQYQITPVSRRAY
jgi:hypothetical protein